MLAALLSTTGHHGVGPDCHAQAQINLEIKRAGEPDRDTQSAQLRHAVNTLCEALGPGRFATSPDQVPEETVVESIRLWIERDGLPASMVLRLLGHLSALGVSTKGFCFEPREPREP